MLLSRSFRPHSVLRLSVRYEIVTYDDLSIKVVFKSNFPNNEYVRHVLTGELERGRRFDGEGDMKETGYCSRCIFD